MHRSIKNINMLLNNSYTNIITTTPTPNFSHRPFSCSSYFSISSQQLKAL